MNDNETMTRTSTQTEENETHSSRLLTLLFLELAVIFFFIPAGRIRIDALHMSTGYDAYKLFPILFVTWWLWRRSVPDRPWPNVPLLLPLVCFFLAALLSTAGSYIPYESATETLEIASYVIFYVMLLDLPWNAARLRWVAAGFLLGNLYLGGTAFREYGEALSTQSLPRINGTFDYPNSLGVYTLLGSTLLVWVFLRCRKWMEKAAVSLALLGVLFAAVFTLSRAAYLGFAVGGIALTLRGSRNLRLSAGLLFLLLAGLAILWTPQMKTRLASSATELRQKEMASRLYIWPAVLDGELPNFFPFGVGLGPILPRRMSDRIASQPDPNALTSDWHPHNLYLDLLFSTGLFGLAAFAWIAWVTRQRLKLASTPEAAVLGAGLLAFLVHQWFEVHLLLGNIPVALTALLALATWETKDAAEPDDNSA